MLGQNKRKKYGSGLTSRHRFTSLIFRIHKSKRNHKTKQRKQNNNVRREIKVQMFQLSGYKDLRSVAHHT